MIERVLIEGISEPAGGARSRHFDYKEWVHEMQGETSFLGVSDAVSPRYRGRISSI